MPSLWSRVLDAVIPQRKMDSLELFREIYGVTPSWSGKSVTLKTAMQVSTAFACGRVIAEGMAMLPWKVLRATGNETNPAMDHPLYDKISTGPNPLQTGFEFVEAMGLHLAFCGNSYAWITRVSNKIDELWLFEPGWVTVKYSFGELPTYEVKSPDGSVRMQLSSEDVWHVRGPSWVSYLGLDFVQLAREALGLSMALEEGQSRMQANGSQVSGVLSVEGNMTEDQHKKLRSWLIKEHEGSSNAGRTMIVDRGAKFTASSMTNVDAQVAEMRRDQIEEVCRFFRVLPIMVGHSDKAATYASAEQMFLAHAVHTIGPWITRIEKSADKNLLTPDDRAQGYYTKFNEKALLRTSAETQANVLSRYVLAGIMTRNEGREVLDRNPIEGLDEPLAPANTFTGNPPDGAESRQQQRDAADEQTQKFVEAMNATALRMADAIKSMPAPVVNINEGAIQTTVEGSSTTIEGTKIDTHLPASEPKIENVVNVAPANPAVEIHNEIPEYEVLEQEHQRDTKGQLVRTVTKKRRSK